MLFDFPFPFLSDFFCSMFVLLSLFLSSALVSYLTLFNVYPYNDLSFILFCSYQIPYSSSSCLVTHNRNSLFLLIKYQCYRLSQNLRKNTFHKSTQNHQKKTLNNLSFNTGFSSIDYYQTQARFLRNQITVPTKFKIKFEKFASSNSHQKVNQFKFSDIYI